MPLGKKHGEEDQSGQEPVDDRYRQLQEELRLIDENMASRRTKIEALMEQLRMIWGGQVLGASASANPQLESTYDSMTFPSLPQTSNLGTWKLL